MRKVTKIIKYFLATWMIFLVTTLLGQKNSTSYTFESLVHADIPSGGPGDGGDGYSGDTGSDTGAPSDIGGVDGAACSDSIGCQDGTFG